MSVERLMCTIMRHTRSTTWMTVQPKKNISSISGKVGWSVGPLPANGNPRQIGYTKLLATDVKPLPAPAHHQEGGNRLTFLLGARAERELGVVIFDLLIHGILNSEIASPFPTHGVTDPECRVALGESRQQRRRRAVGNRVSSIVISGTENNLLGHVVGRAQRNYILISPVERSRAVQKRRRARVIRVAGAEGRRLEASRPVEPVNFDRKKQRPDRPDRDAHPQLLRQGQSIQARIPVGNFTKSYCRHVGHTG